MTKSPFAKLTTGLWTLAILIIMVSCSQFEEMEPTMENQSDEVAHAGSNNITNMLNARISTGLELRF